VNSTINKIIRPVTAAQRVSRAPLSLFSRVPARDGNAARIARAAVLEVLG
jgi:hypothetical protein